jgi:KUP system potassium uptake protein
VFLCVTGAEALYADMGHFGARPIRLAWSALVFPSLVLNYAGQAALVLEGAPSSDNIFYRLCPSVLLVPLVVLATIATIIASQSIITGAFSMTRQAIQLGWLPRLHITQTSAEGYGQIYVGSVNWLLMLVTLGLTVGFGKSDNLASAYGIAVSATMLMTSVLLFIAMREIWGWSLVTAGAVAGVFMLSTQASSRRTSPRWRRVDTCRSSWLRSFTASCSSGTSERPRFPPVSRMRLCLSTPSWRRSWRDQSPGYPALRFS